MSAIMAVIRRTVQPLCERAPTDATRARASARRTPPTQLHLFQRQTMTMTCMMVTVYGVPTYYFCLFDLICK